MGFWDDPLNYVAPGLNWLGGKLAGSMDRTNNQYAGVDRGNFNMPGFDQMQGQGNALFNQIGGRQAPQLGPQQMAGQSGFRDQQQQLGNMLMGQAQGQNSIGMEQLRQGADANLAQQYALASSNRANPAMAARLGSQQAGMINQGLAGQGALLGLQQRQGAMGQLGQLLGQGRQADEGLNQFNAGQGNQMNMGQAQLQQQQYGQNNQGQLGALGLLGQNAQAQQQGGMGYEQQRTNRYGANLGTPTPGQTLLSGASALGPALLGG